MLDRLMAMDQQFAALNRSQSDRRALDAAVEVARDRYEIPADVMRDQTPAPAGELRSHPASANEDREQLAASEDQGDLPNELVAKAPPSSGTAPESDPRWVGRAPDPEFRSPAAISLN